MKKFKSIAKKILITIVTVFLLLCVVLLTLFVSALIAGNNNIDKNIKVQNQYLDYLKNEYYINYKPVNEQEFTNFNIDDTDIKFNEVAFLGTHNSYQIFPTKQYATLMNAVDFVAFGLVETKNEFNMDTLTQQLELGIRNLEIDVITQNTEGKTNIRVCHTPILDNSSSCYNFRNALEEIKLWSDNNPNHLPVTIIIEPKGKVVEINGFKKFSLDYCNQIDGIIRDTLSDSLLTPADMLRDYKHFKEMREADDWLTLSETRGKIMVLLHDCDVTDSYISQDMSIKSQAMFPMLRYGDRNETYTSFVLNNNPDDAAVQNKKLIEECKLIVRTRADDYPTFSDERYAKADECGSQITTTDFPRRAVKSENHIYDFDGYMFKFLK